MSTSQTTDDENTEAVPVSDLDPSAILVMRSVGETLARPDIQPTIGDVHARYQSSFGATPFTTIIKAISRLEDAGYLERTNCLLGDGRRTSIELSPRAERFLRNEFGVEVGENA